MIENQERDWLTKKHLSQNVTPDVSWRFCIRSLMIAGFALVFGFKLLASQVDEVPTFVETKPIDTFLFCVAGVTTNGITTNSITPDRELVFCIRTTAPTNDQSVVWVPAEPEYAYRIELLDSNGVSMTKTDLGKRVGTNFFDFDIDAPQKGIKRQFTHADSVERARKGEVSHTAYLLRPVDYFRIDEPGLYTLRINFQVYVLLRTGPGPGEYKPRLIRFPVLEYPIRMQHRTPKDREPS